MNSMIKKATVIMIAAILALSAAAIVGGCSSNSNPHDYCDCDEKIEQLQTENSKLNDRVDALESQLSELMATTTAATTTTTAATTATTTEPTTTTTAATTKAYNGGGGNKTTKATTTKPTTAPTTKPTTAATTKPTSGDGFGTDVGM